MSIPAVTRKCYSCHVEKHEKEFHRMKQLEDKPAFWLCSKKCVNLFLIIMRKERSTVAALKVPVMVLSLNQTPEAQPKSGSLAKKF